MYPVASCAVGVGQRCATASDNCPRRCPGCVESFQSVAQGVGHEPETVTSDGPPSRFSDSPDPFSPSHARGVGQDEQPLAAMGSSGVVRAQATPLRIEPQRGQVPEHAVESSSSESCDVLHEDEAGSNLAHDPSEVRPEPRPLPVDAFSLPGVADVLTGEAASDEIHDSTPWAAVEGGDIRPHRARSQPTFFHLADQSRSGESFPLHEADRASADSLEAEGQSASAGEEFDGT
jgi:hypothetical protein